MMTYNVTDAATGASRELQPTILGIGTETLDHHFRPFMFCIASGETAECYDAMFSSLAQECVDVNGCEWVTKWVRADAHPAVSVSARHHYGESMVGQTMFYFHVRHNIEQKWNNAKDRPRMWPGMSIGRLVSSTQMLFCCPEYIRVA